MKGKQYIDITYKAPARPRPYSCLLITHTADLDLSLLPAGRNIGLVLALDHRHLPSPTLLHHLVTGDRPFALLLSSSPHPSLIEYIILLLCCRNYISVEGSPLILVNHPPSPSFRATLEGQGWHTISCLIPDTERILSSQDQIAVRADRLIFQAYTMKEEFFFINGRDFLDTLSLEQSLDQYCHELLLDHPFLETWILQRRQLQEKLDRLQNKNRVTEERLHNAETTIDIIRNKYKDDYDTLFNWYQQEYEVLPRWYKQFGQLIKVIMGKRSLKSLLNTLRRRTHRMYGFLSSTKKHVS